MTRPIKMGRPPRADYEAMRPTIQGWIDSGMSIDAVGRQLGLTFAGARLVLRRMGIESVGSKIRRLGLQTLLEQVNAGSKP